LSYTTPPTFVSGGTVTASNLNILSDDISYLYGVAQGVTASGAQVSKSAQTISTGTDTNISFSTENFDLGGWWSSGTAVVVPSGAIPAGYTSILILVAARVRWAANGTGSRAARLMKNGSIFGNSSTSGLSGDTLDQVVLDFTTVVAGDSIALQVYQSSGGNLSADTAQLTVMRYAPYA
jgi:hypothetical protein